MKKALLICPLFALSLMSCSLNKATLEIEYNPLLNPEDTFYYVGDSIDKKVEIDGELVPIMPSFYSEKDGEKIQDLKYGEDIKLSGYDLSTPGQQTVKAECISNSDVSSTTYNIVVLELKVGHILASDYYHLNITPYKVGDKFEPISLVDGAKKGLNVSIFYNDPFRKSETYFADDEALNGITYDLSNCKVDENNLFTEAGEFSVKVTYKDCFTNYSIKVIN